MSDAKAPTTYRHGNDNGLDGTLRVEGILVGTWRGWEVWQGGFVAWANPPERRRGDFTGPVCAAVAADLIARIESEMEPF